MKLETIIGFLDLIMEESTCISRQTSAVIMDPNGVSIRGYGYNGSSIQIPSCKLRNNCLRKNSLSGVSLDNCIAVHAEERAIIQAQSLGLNVLGCSLYCSDKPCIHCLKVIIESGITNVFYIRDYNISHPEAYNMLSRQLHMTNLEIDNSYIRLNRKKHE